jgi:hypothetical protein
LDTSDHVATQGGIGQLSVNPDEPWRRLDDPRQMSGGFHQVKLPTGNLPAFAELRHGLESRRVIVIL